MQPSSYEGAPLSALTRRFRGACDQRGRAILASLASGEASGGGTGRTGRDEPAGAIFHKNLKVMGGAGLVRAAWMHSRRPRQLVAPNRGRGHRMAGTLPRVLGGQL